MPLVINVSSDLDKLTQDLDDLGKQQIPFATSLALNTTAALARVAVRGVMGQVFDRPKPFTLNSVYVTSSTKRNLEAVVGLKDGKGSRQGAAQYLRAEITGGQRDLTPFEQRFAEAAHGQGFALPGSAAKLDSYGNLQRSTRAAIINAQGQKQGDPAGIFVIPVGAKSHLKPGVYQRIPIKVKTKKRRGVVISSSGGGTRLKALLLFEPKAFYAPRFNFSKTVTQSVVGNFGKQFELAMIRARFSAYTDFTGGAE
jgi:hypothetical protein